jgi:hypothetical protein
LDGDRQLARNIFGTDEWDVVTAMIVDAAAASFRSVASFCDDGTAAKRRLGKR